MRLDEARCREVMENARVARLATAGADGHPHIVPITFALVGDTLITAIDHKPKTTTKLRRLRNIVEDARVAVLTDHYDDDWSALWWVRADGTARIVEKEVEYVQTLIAKYPQYRAEPPDGPIVVVTIDKLSGWAAT